MEPSVEHVTDHFVNYLYSDYKGNRHVRRVASWLGLVALGIEKLKDRWWFSHARQLMFEKNGHRYKVKYNHTLKPRGGLEVVEVAPKPGSPEIRTVKSFCNLADCERFHRKPTL